ncbi:MAG: hypothetical protein KF768_09950 [Phycisphaeraceae bacterium]|nr:hypothetical protein [Phycisphaeraceae bacterium]
MSGLKVVLRGLKVVLRGLKVVLRGLKVVLSGLEVVLSGLEVVLSGLEVVLSGLKAVLRGLEVVLTGERVAQRANKDRRPSFSATAIGAMNGPGRPRPDACPAPPIHRSRSVAAGGPAVKSVRRAVPESRPTFGSRLL